MTGTEAPALPPELARVHMIGIGGAGMSGIAKILLARGGAVSGSDAKDSRVLLDLRSRGAVVRVGHDRAHLDLLDGGPTTVVTIQAAIGATNPELVEAQARGVPTAYRSAVLATLMEGSQAVLVAGTHGKTSTTSLAVVALQHCGLDPSFAVGGEINEAGTNAHQGTGGVFVAEADESDGSLLRYTPAVAIVTNVEADHLDYFGTAEAYVQVFDDFARRLVPGGAMVVCLDDEGSRALAGRVAAQGVRVVGYGSDQHAPPGVEVGARLLEWGARDGGGQGLVQLVGEDSPRVMRLAVPGRHMALNALAALLAGREVGADVGGLLDGLALFGGVRRRFQYIGREAGVRVFDDYAHHPTEVRAVLSTAQDLMAKEAEEAAAARGKVLVVFQPHLYSRTVTFAREFAAALSLADTVVVLDVYGAREDPVPGVDGRLIADQVTKPVRYEPDLSLLARRVAELASSGDIVITMGAGDVTMQGNQILDALRTRSTVGPQ